MGIFTLRQIKAATNNFSKANKIGEGGFGPVYKGNLSDGTIIAVKQLSSKSRQGNREFLNELGMISALQHPCLVKLYGFCVEGDQLLLVYEYIENNSLARAFGYMAPEYAMHGYLTDKADVYSFGVVALEIVSGRSNMIQRQKEEAFHLLDWKIGFGLLQKEVTARINVSLLCTNVTASLRPTMSLVVSMLEGRSVVQEVFSESSEALDEKKLEAMRQRYQEIIEENKLTEIQWMTHWLLHHLQQISIL
ncbi:hypothetical protein JHK87_016290 [Glycine soja]|nr:hypothetical protein JHK87_016290 [Glycine soja]